MLAVPVPMWIIFEKGMDARKPKAATRWTHHRILWTREDPGELHPAEEERGEEVADVGDGGDLRVRGRDARRLDQEARHGDEQDEEELERVVVVLREPFRPEDPPAQQGRGRGGDQEQRRTSRRTA